MHFKFKHRKHKRVFKKLIKKGV